MAQVLFVSPADVIKRTGINGNVDRDQMVQFIKIAQDIHIQGILGTKLFNKFAAEIEADTLSGNYLTLFTNYVQDMVIHFAAVEILPYVHYKVANGGIYTKGAENGNTISKEELDYLVQKERDVAEHYARRFVDHMSFYNSLYPEYNTSSDDDMYPSKNQNFNGWVL